MKYKTIRHQKPFSGGRFSLPSCVLPKIRHAVENDSLRHGVSKSFVIAVILAEHYGIGEQEKI